MRINTTNRQFLMVLALLLTMSLLACKISMAQEILRPEAAFPYTIEAVSYTHLTLPTKA